MSFRISRSYPVELLYVTLGVWVGIYAFRSFVPTAVWNLSDTLPLYLKGGIAVGVHLLGVAGCLLPATRRPRAPAALALTVAAAGIARQVLIGNDVLGSALSLITWVLWLWWLAAYVRQRGRDFAHLLAPAVALAFALQVGMQGAWHGLDLPMARGTLAMICALAINGIFAFTAFHDQRTPSSSEAPLGNVAFIALGCVLFLELTLFANVGRIGALSGLGLVQSTLLIQGGLIAAVLLLAMPRDRITVFALAIGLLFVAFYAPALYGVKAIALAAGQIAVIGLLASSAGRPARSAGLSFAAGMILLFVLLFLFYNRYEWWLLWSVAVLALTATTLPEGREIRTPAAFAQLALLGIALTFAGTLAPVRPAARPASGNGTHRFMTYNVHQGFDDAGVPAMQHIADEIERVDPDVIALQEMGRGWTFLGGADLVAYMRYRFPEHALHFVPVNGQLWGVALMSRLPISDQSGTVFAADAGIFSYGFAQATVRVGDADVCVIGVHLSADLEAAGAGMRVDQMEEVLSAATAGGNTIVAGDFNAHPDDPPIARITGAGFTDAGAAVGLGGAATWPASAPNERIDYVFVKGLQAVQGAVPRITTSDHLPVWIDFTVKK